MRAVITVIGKDMVGILAKVSNLCYSKNANIIEVTQSVLQDMFAMIMLADISKLTCEFRELSAQMQTLGEELSLSIHVMHEDIFDSMHKI